MLALVEQITRDLRQAPRLPTAWCHEDVVVTLSAIATRSGVSESTVKRRIGEAELRLLDEIT